MPIVLYLTPGSPACRTVLMTAAHLGIKLVKKSVDLEAGENMKPEFLAMNPQHTVPTMDDDGFQLWESRAISMYLVNKYAPDSSLYPKDPQARAKVDMVLNYDQGNLYKALCDIYPFMCENKPEEPEKMKNVKESLGILETLLKKTTYAACNHVTLADYSILSALEFAKEYMKYSFADFPKITAWFEKMKKEAPKYKETE